VKPLGSDPVEMVDPADKTGCASTTESLLPANQYNIYVYITKDEAGNDIIDDEFISFTPQTGSAGSNTDTYDEQNSIS